MFPTREGPSPGAVDRLGVRPQLVARRRLADAPLVRDETHRFANSRNNRLRSQEALHLLFEQLPHIGTKRAAALLRSFSSIEKLVGASEEAVAAAAGISDEQAKEALAAAQSFVKNRSGGF